MPIEMYGESRFMHFWVDILIVLYIFGFGTARLGEWRLNHIHSINSAEIINASVSDSSAEIDYSAMLSIFGRAGVTLPVTYELQAQYI